MNPNAPAVPRLIGSALKKGSAKSFDGVEIYWELHGPSNGSEKTPKRAHLFCYGLACSFNQWRYQIAHFSKNDYCIVFDYRGHHLSDIPDSPKQLNMGCLGKDAAAVLKDINLGMPAHVWSHSMGCNVGIELAAAHPELVKTLNLCCGSLSNPFEHMFGNDWLNRGLKPLIDLYESQPEIFNKGWGWAQKQSHALQLIVKLAGFNMNATSTSDDVETYVKAVASIEPRVFFPLLRELMRATTKGIAARVKTPACVIAGTQDHVTPTVKQKEMAEILKNSVFIEIPTGSHNVQLDFGEYLCLKIENVWKAQNLW